MLKLRIPKLVETNLKHLEISNVNIATFFKLLELQL